MLVSCPAGGSPAASTASAGPRRTVGNPSRNSSRLSPAASASHKLRTGTRVVAEHGSTPITSGSITTCRIMIQTYTYASLAFKLPSVRPSQHFPSIFPTSPCATAWPARLYLHDCEARFVVIRIVSEQQSRPTAVPPVPTRPRMAHDHSAPGSSPFLRSPAPLSRPPARHHHQTARPDPTDPTKSSSPANPSPKKTGGARIRPRNQPPHQKKRGGCPQNVDSAPSAPPPPPKKQGGGAPTPTPVSPPFPPRPVQKSPLPHPDSAFLLRPPKNRGGCLDPATQTPPARRLSASVRQPTFPPCRIASNGPVLGASKSLVGSPC